ncbi:DUF1844 domain-containing protein [Planctomicrobium sp. SH668]|uniref:DUF1844 domain-containing protein n=1 Tax=Planctomicrobium sp. SH668 TaxID=3448126 RepID=UPI003F5C833E
MPESSSPQDKPQIELSSDEDWKNRVKAEDEKQDRQFQESVENDDKPIDPSMLPDASMLTLLQMLSSQAIVALGLLPSSNGKTTIQLPVAKHFIDLLTVLEKKTKGNLVGDESKFLDGTLHELRMAYVAVSKSQPST